MGNYFSNSFVSDSCQVILINTFTTSFHNKVSPIKTYSVLTKEQMPFQYCSVRLLYRLTCKIDKDVFNISDVKSALKVGEVVFNVDDDFAVWAQPSQWVLDSKLMNLLSNFMPGQQRRYQIEALALLAIGFLKCPGSKKDKARVMFDLLTYNECLESPTKVLSIDDPSRLHSILNSTALNATSTKAQ